MSFWTHVNGMITVSVVGRTQHEKRYVLETVLDHLPIVSGSEGDMQIQVLQMPGYSISSSHDEFYNRYKGRRGVNEYGFMELQSNYYLIITGDLRDRTYLQTYMEFQKWLCRLAKRVEVVGIMVRVSGDDLRKHDWYSSAMITNARPYTQMYEYRRSKDDEPGWCDYLLWEEDPYTGLPIEHVYKYIVSDDVDAEMQRRIEFRRKRAEE